MTDIAPPELSLLVVTWRTRDLVAECLDAIAAELNGLPYEVVVVDNDSRDGTADLLTGRAAADPRIHAILSPTNTGYAGGNNLAYRASRGAFIGVVNPDLLVTREAVSTMVEHLRADPSLGIVSCELVGTDGNPQTLHRRLPGLTSTLFTRTLWGGRFDRIVLRGWFGRRLRLADVPHHGQRDVGQAAGAFLFLRRSTIEGALGGELFDESLPILVNDVDLSRRVHDVGLRVTIDYDQQVTHHGGGSLRQLDRGTHQLLFFDGFAHYLAKHESPWKVRVLRLLFRTTGSAAGGPLKILQLITDRDRRGAQVFALDLALGLQGLGASVDTVALAPGTHGDLLQVRALGTRRFAFGTLKALRRLAHGYDVVVAHGSTTLPVSALGLIGTGLPIVYRQIGDPEVWAASWPRRLRSAAFLRRMSAVVALSSSTSTTMRRHYWLRSRPTVTVIPNAVPEERFRRPTPRERTEARTALGVPVEPDVLLFVGALTPEKGVEFAIRASAELPSAVLVIVGDGPRRTELEASASRRMPNRCFFVGPLEDPRVAYWSADLFIFPSLSEAMPAVLIEAGLCGLASVTTDVGAVRDVVEHGTTGLVVPSGDAEAIASAVSTLMSDASRRLAMGVAAAERCASLFTINHIASTWFDLLMRVGHRRP